MVKEKARYQEQGTAKGLHKAALGLVEASGIAVVLAARAKEKHPEPLDLEHRQALENALGSVMFHLAAVANESGSSLLKIAEQSLGDSK